MDGGGRGHADARAAVARRHALLARVAAEAARLLFPPRPPLPDGVAEGRTRKAAYLYTPFIIRLEVEASSVLVWDNAYWQGQKQNTRNLYLQADDKRCMWMLESIMKIAITRGACKEYHGNQTRYQTFLHITIPKIFQNRTFS